MSFASLCVFTYAYPRAYPVSFLSKCNAKNRKEVLAVRTSYHKEVLALLSCSRKEVLAVSRTQAQATRNQPQEELLLADAKRSSCACIIFWLYCNVICWSHWHNKFTVIIQHGVRNRPFYSCMLSHLAMNASEAGVDLALIQTSLLFSCRCKLVSITTTCFAQ